jgi:hypothetical protein
MYQRNGRIEGLDPDPAMCSGIVLRAREGEMRIPDVVLKSVVYLGNATDKGIFKAIGTGFFAAILRSREQPTFYLVTADHVRRGLVNDQNFAIRLNDGDGKAQILRSPTTFKWWRHPTDKSVDAAVYPWTFREFPFASFPFARFVTEELHQYRRDSDPGIGIGDEIFIVGLFRKLAGQTRITPIVRHGHLAMMPIEPISTENYGDGLYYLVEAFSTAGLSGSPVFVNETVYFEYRGSRPRAYPERGDIHPVGMAVGPTHCLGLVHGIMPIETIVELAGKADPAQKWHSGISMIVPASKILEIINQPKLIEYEEVVQRALREDKPVETAVAEFSEPDKTTKRGNRDVEIPPINRKKFLDDLMKATRRPKVK